MYRKHFYYNSKVIREEEKNEKQEKTCNCRKKEECPLKGQCLLENVVYQATLTPLPNPDDDQPPDPPSLTQPETYVGLASTTFKARYANHKTSFNLEKHSSKTALSIHIWELKRKNIDYKLTWKVIDRGQQFSPVTGLCSLCTCEKYQILFHPEKASLNKKEEMFNHCLHKEPKLLDKIDKS